MAEWGNVARSMDILDYTKEPSLLARLNRIEAYPAGYFAVHLNLSKLQPNHKQSHFIEVAARTFDILIDDNHATLFTLTNKDLALICRNVDIDDVDIVVEKVRALFIEDPLTEIDETAYEDLFSTWHDLSNPENFAVFFAAITDLAIEAEQIQAAEAVTLDKEQQLGEPLWPSNLAEINRKLKGMRVANMIKRQACLQVHSGGGGDLVFFELRLSIAEIKKRVAPEINLFASPWLFQYLTETLDKRLLAALIEEDFDEISTPLSINLNISTVLSRDFQNFHKVVDGNTSKIIVEFQIIDIFADIKNYVYARDLLHQRGYRVAVDGLNRLSLQYFEPADLQSDFIKISWDPGVAGNDEENWLPDVRGVIEKVGHDSLIFDCADSEKAVKWGLSLGISRFQGLFIDKLVQVIGGGQNSRSGREVG